MNKIKFKGKKIKLLGKVNLKNKKLNIKAVDKNGKTVSTTDFKSDVKVISSFPKLNTSVCDNQTKKIVEIAKKYQNVNFISITMDSVETIKKWCLSHSLTNIDILSDLKYGEFGKTTNLLIESLKMLARGFIILNKNNEVIDYFYKTEITDNPMFNEMESVLILNV